MNLNKTKYLHSFLRPPLPSDFLPKWEKEHRLKYSRKKKLNLALFYKMQDSNTKEQVSAICHFNYFILLILDQGNCTNFLLLANYLLEVCGRNSSFSNINLRQLQATFGKNYSNS